MIGPFLLIGICRVVTFYSIVSCTGFCGGDLYTFFGDMSNFVYLGGLFSTFILLKNFINTYGGS